MGIRVSLEEQIRGQHLVQCKYRLPYGQTNVDFREIDASEYRGVVAGPCYSGTQFLAEYLGMLYEYFATIIGVVVVLTIIIASIMLMMSGFSEELASTAKKVLIAAVVGLIMLFSIPGFLKFVNQDFYGGGAGNEDSLRQLSY